VDAASRLARLLLRWEDEEAAGRPVSPADLCPGEPELAARLGQLRHFARGMDRLADELNEPPRSGTGLPRRCPCLMDPSQPRISPPPSDLGRRGAAR